MVFRLALSVFNYVTKLASRHLDYFTRHLYPLCQLQDNPLISCSIRYLLSSTALQESTYIVVMSD